MKYLLPFLILLLAACGNEQGNLPKSGEHTIKVLINDNGEEQQESFLQSILSVEIIPLELGDMFLNKYSQMRVTDDRIYIFTKQTHELSIFSSTGQKIAIISNFGDAPEHYVNIENFSLCEDSIISMYDGAKANALFWDKNGKFIREQSMRNVPANNMAYINDSLFLMYTKTLTLFERNKDIFRFVDKDGNVKKTSSRLPSWIRKSALVSVTNTPFSYYGQEVLWHDSWTPYIYSFISDSVYCKYTIDFGKYNVPESFFVEHEKDIEDNLTDIMNTFSENKWASSIELFQENDNYVFFQYLWGHTVCFALWDKRIEQCYTLPWFGLKEWIVLAGGFLCSYQNNFYSISSVKDIQALIKYKDEVALDERILSLLRQFEEYQTKVHLEEDDYILLSIKMK